MEMRAAASARPWVGPPRDDFRIGHDLVIQQEQGYIGKLLEQVIANFPGQALPFLGIHGLRQLHVALVDERILKIMPRTFTPIRSPNPFFGRSQTNDVGPDSPCHLLVPPHASDFPFQRLDGRFDPHGVKIDRQGFDHLWMLGLAGTGVREQSDVDRARWITSSFNSSLARVGLYP